MTFRAVAMTLAMIASFPFITDAQSEAASGAGRRATVAVTRQHGQFGGQELDYTATVAENLMIGSDGVPNASLVTIAYVRAGVVDKNRRPVAFVFNGGPGGSSSPLHMGGIGPRRINNGAIANNPDSLLDVSDLVFIDPVGTGFSRPFTAKAEKLYWNDAGDSDSVAEVIGRWIKANGREQSPHFLIGESYGTVRNGLILKNHSNLRFDGVVQVAAVSTLHGDQVYVAQLPTMAASAWFWKKTTHQDRDVFQAFKEGETFGSGEYAAALAKGELLSPSERHRIAGRMSELIALPVALLEERNLRPSKIDFMFNVIHERDLRTGLLDTRVTAPLKGASDDAIDDPALMDGHAREILGRGLGTAAGRAKSAIATPPAAVPAAPRARSMLETYLTRDLQFKTAETNYRGVNFDIALAWGGGRSGSGVSMQGGYVGPDVQPYIAKAMKENPQLRLFWTNGTYDLTTPAYAVVLDMENVGVPTDRTVSMIVPGPHSVFQEDANRPVLSKALRQFIRGEKVDQ